MEADLGDHLTFRLIRSAPTGLGENQPGVATRRYSFACIDVDHDTQVDTVVVDVVVGPPPVGRPEVVEQANRLYLPGGKRSSRVKDLVDLVVIAHTQTVDLDELRAAIDSKRELSGIAPFEHFAVPAEWTRTYPGTAKGVPAAESLSAQTAAGLVASFVDPALGDSSNPAVWGSACAGLDSGYEQSR